MPVKRLTVNFFEAHGASRSRYCTLTDVTSDVNRCLGCLLRQLLVLNDLFSFVISTGLIMEDVNPRKVVLHILQELKDADCSQPIFTHFWDGFDGHGHWCANAI
jgi:hypothetical protein